MKITNFKIVSRRISVFIEPTTYYIAIKILSDCLKINEVFSICNSSQIYFPGTFLLQIL